MRRESVNSSEPDSSLPRWNISRAKRRGDYRSRAGVEPPVTVTVTPSSDALANRGIPLANRGIPLRWPPPLRANANVSQPQPAERIDASAR